MAAPKVFISSTWYDLKYIRENLRHMVGSLGYQPILSEDGAVYYNPMKHTAESCLAEIVNAQLFVLIIGGRHGSTHPGTNHSVTNMEYREAVKQKIPVFALVEQGVFNDFGLYKTNLSNEYVDLEKLHFPNVDSFKIFEFVDEVASTAVNNALVPFRDFADIDSYLRQQWAGMMFDFLTQRSEERRVADTLRSLEEMNSRIEKISQYLLESVGSDEAKVEIKLYDEMLNSEAVRDLAYWGKKLAPVHIIRAPTLLDCAVSAGVAIDINEADEWSIGGGGAISRPKFTNDSKEYQQLRDRMHEVLRAHGVSIDAYLASKADVPPPAATRKFRGS